ncbi:DEAD/DEAH box helicase [Streptomyces sp. 5-6(2022)]|uniref:DEAD/DEAH box helicase n=1 Tax=Streptomyces sp. 5-6(2022) TaxID=2936510 RepID=UPI0023B9B0AE|nr:DEAD/DEAH box helicase [Streptomyces sp. 5-6(2022)]
MSDTGALTELVAHPELCALDKVQQHAPAPVSGHGAYAARDAFDMTWEALAPPAEDPPQPQPVVNLLPREWAELLPHPTFNPAQIAAVPAIVDSDQHVLVVAPTGAGKTPIGMVAALNAHFQGRKAAWLVPQRSLTDELDRDLEIWRRHGLEVVRLSGEFATDIELIKQADVWVSTTEKFESLCRAASMRSALADVGCLIIDEIHLLGDPTRGPILEALLARVREAAAEVRIVGLSATVSNAEAVAEWLHATFVRVSWRPTRLISQLPMIPVSSDRQTERLTRAQLAVRLAQQFTADDGSVLIFCGSKRNVRATALAVAAARGVNTHAIDLDDTEKIRKACEQAGIGLHYRDWPYKHDAERGFRERNLNTLVATSTVAAGVNLPARAVIVRDTQIGLDEMDVSMVLQMFGRAGRVGAGEHQGWAYLITDESERAIWQAKLAAGFTVNSQIRSSLPDHVLAEVVQGRISTRREAEAWWMQTLAYHQGHRRLEPLCDALFFLEEAEYLRLLDGDRDPALRATELGRLTSRLMVSTTTAHSLRRLVFTAPLPPGPDAAEDTLFLVLVEVLAELQQTPSSEQARAAAATILQANGHLELIGASTAYTRGGLAAPPGLAPGDFAMALLLMVANSPRAFRSSGRFISGIPIETMFPIFNEAERYLYWLGAQGTLGTLHPWAVITSGDLARRIRWRQCGAPRGSGRLLWMLEQMATGPRAADLVPQLWRAASRRNVTRPDWHATVQPVGCQLPDEKYTALLRERVTDAVLVTHEDLITFHLATGQQASVWNGSSFAHHPGNGDEQSVPYPSPLPDDPTSGQCGAAVFSRRGDGIGTGWLAAYHGYSIES